MKTAFSCGDHLSGNLGNVREFNSCQGNNRELTKNQGNVRSDGEKCCHGKLFIANFMFGATPVLSRLLWALYEGCSESL